MVSFVILGVVMDNSLVAVDSCYLLEVGRMRGLVEIVGQTFCSRNNACRRAESEEIYLSR